MLTTKIMAWLRGEDARKSFDAEIARLAIGASGRFARGNIALQHGAVQTGADLERSRQLARKQIEREAARS